MPLFDQLKKTFIDKFFAGRRSSIFGRFDSQLKVSDMFERGQVLENHTYYYIGPDAEPDAVLALHNAYTLTPSLWKHIDMTASQLLSWAEQIDNRHRTEDIYDGAVILDGNGNKLGFWYSYLKWTTIKRGEGQRVTIYTPDTTIHVT